MIRVDELNTGPDTTENVNEVYESRFMSCRSLRDFMSAHPGIQVIDTIEAGNLVKITYKNPTEMESKDEKPVLYDPRTYCKITEEDQDPESERISKAVERMKWRNRNNFKDVDAAETPDRGTLEEVVDEARKRGCTFTGTPESDEKIRAAMSGWSEKKNTDFPGAKQGEEWLEKQQEEQVRDSGDVMFCVDLETQGLQGNAEPLISKKCLEKYRTPVTTPGADVDDQMYPTTEEMKKYIDEQCNKNVSQDEDKIPQGYYKYSNILKRMDDTHTRKNNDYGDAAYQGYKKFGDYYFMVQLHNKYQRLESLTIGNKTQQVKEESIDDTLLDMANYAVMYLESRHRND